MKTHFFLCIMLLTSFKGFLCHSHDNLINLEPTEYHSCLVYCCMETPDLPIPYDDMCQAYCCEDDPNNPEGEIKDKFYIPRLQPEKIGNISKDLDCCLQNPIIPIRKQIKDLRRIVLCIPSFSFLIRSRIFFCIFCLDLLCFS